MINEQLFKECKIKSVKGFRFGNKLIQCEMAGLALHHPLYGFVSFGSVDKQYNIELPYTPKGGRSVLKDLIASGLTDYSGIKWIKPYNN